MADFTGKRYVVTGAASGIGDAVAARLLGAGAEVYCLDRNTSGGGDTAHRGRLGQPKEHRCRD